MNTGNKVKRKSITIGFTMIYIAVFVGVIQFLFDENHTNDHYGWLLLLAFWMFRSLHLMAQDIHNAQKKSALYNLLFAILVFGVLIWRGTVYL